MNKAIGSCFVCVGTYLAAYSLRLIYLRSSGYSSLFKTLFKFCGVKSKHSAFLTGKGISGSVNGMARQLRIERAGAWYHITARGNERRSIYRHQRDYRHFCELLDETVERFRWRLHAYVLMPNHYHLLVET